AVGVGGAPHSTVAESENTGKILGDADKIAFEKYGMRTYYHNHSEEFAVFEDGSRSIDIIGSFCPLEIDTYWSHHAGIDNYSFLTENKDRIIYYHVKDGVGGKPRALGEGDCDVKAVIKAAKDNNVEWIIVENDDPVPTGFEDITRSLAYLKSIM
nr:sugar phosphate isomerase/epimerase [Clostridiales bacterium]